MNLEKRKQSVLKLIPSRETIEGRSRASMWQAVLNAGIHGHVTNCNAC